MGYHSNVFAAFSEEQTERLTNISRTQLRYWDRTGFYRPSFAEKNRRTAYSRVYAFKDIVALRVIDVLRNQYRISLQHLRDVSSKLGRLESDPDRWIETKLYPLDGRVVWHEPGSDLPQVVASGQYVVAIVLRDVVEATKQAVSDLRIPRDKSKVGQIERSRYIVRNARVLAGTRIPVGAIKRFAAAGYTPDQILREYPDITREDIQAALDYEDSVPKPSAA